MRTIYAGIFGLALTACAGAPPQSCPAGTRPMARLELFFGGNIGAPGGVSETAWRAFLNAEVTPRFPEGFTVTDAYGQWRNGQGVIEAERSKHFIVIVPDARAEIGRAHV